MCFGRCTDILRVFLIFCMFAKFSAAMLVILCCRLGGVVLGVAPLEHIQIAHAIAKR